MSKENKLKYRLWVEQNHMCPYNQKKITCHQLFTSAVEVDHILPYQRSADDSYMNKVVCMASANQEKGNKTPHEWLGRDSQRFDEIKQYVAKNFPRAKQQRFFAKDMEALTALSTGSSPIRPILPGKFRPIWVKNAHVLASPGFR